MAKVMNLMDPRQMERYEPVNPVYRAMGELDREMETVLQRRDLTDAEKVQRYNQILQRFLEYDNKRPGQVQETNPSLHGMSHGMSHGMMEQQTIELIPKLLKKKATVLMQHIRDHPDMGWTKEGAFVYKGRAVSGSNMIDLVADLMRARKNRNPPGWQQFARALQETNIPQELVGNQARWHYIQGYESPSDDYSTAEEPSPIRTRSGRSRVKQSASHTRTPRSRSPRSRTPRRSPLIKKEIENWDPW